MSKATISLTDSFGDRTVFVWRNITRVEIDNERKTVVYFVDAEGVPVKESLEQVERAIERAACDE